MEFWKQCPNFRQKNSHFIRDLSRETELILKTSRDAD